MAPTRAEVLATVNAAPEGLTTRQIAARLHGSIYQVSTVVSKLGCWGMVAKTRDPAYRNGTAFIWKPLPRLPEEAFE